MRILIGSLVLGSLALAGCSSESADGQTPSSTTAQGGGMGGAMGGGMGGAMGGAMGGGMMAAPQPAKPYEPKREPAFHFEPGGPVADADLGKYHVTMACAVDGEDVGTMTFELWADQTPITARNFLRYCDEGFYDGLTFHRIMRDFMIQGGDPQGTGAGAGPHGPIEPEFSEAPERGHGYGVLSMARSQAPNSASSQFFVCTDESQGVWGLDGQYASFGKLTSGVKTLEALADVPTGPGGGGPEPSRPTKKVTITKAEVVEGPAPTGETIERPVAAPDLGGEPARVAVQHVLISFDGAQGGVGATRSKEEAEALANEILEKAKGGADFNALVVENSDDPVNEGDPNPGVYRMFNTGVRDREIERKQFDLNKKYMARGQELQSKAQSGELSPEDFQKAIQTLQAEAQLEAGDIMYMPRAQMVPGFGDTAFGLEVGAVALLPFDPQASPFGWHILKRVE